MLQRLCLKTYRAHTTHEVAVVGFWQPRGFQLNLSGFPVLAAKIVAVEKNRKILACRRYVSLDTTWEMVMIWLVLRSAERQCLHVRHRWPRRIWRPSLTG